MGTPQVPIVVDDATGVWNVDAMPMILVPRHFFVNNHLAIEAALGEEKYAELLFAAGYKSAYTWCEQEARTHGLSGAEVEDVKNAIVMATSSTRFLNLNYWVDERTGFDYLVQLQVPPLQIDEPDDLGTLPLESVNPLVNLMVRDVAAIREGREPNSSVAQVLDCYRVIGELAASLERQDGWS